MERERRRRLFNRNVSYVFLLTVWPRPVTQSCVTRIKFESAAAAAAVVLRPVVRLSRYFLSRKSPRRLNQCKKNPRIFFSFFSSQARAWILWQDGSRLSSCTTYYSATESIWRGRRKKILNLTWVGSWTVFCQKYGYPFSLFFYFPKILCMLLALIILLLFIKCELSHISHIEVVPSVSCCVLCVLMCILVMIWGAKTRQCEETAHFLDYLAAFRLECANQIEASGLNSWVVRGRVGSVTW